MEFQPSSFQSTEKNLVQNNPKKFLLAQARANFLLSQEVRANFGLEYSPNFEARANSINKKTESTFALSVIENYLKGLSLGFVFSLLFVVVVHIEGFAEIAPFVGGKRLGLGPKAVNPLLKVLSVFVEFAPEVLRAV